jgi:Arc/MetJ-type ribon-helix-helix transcriptional regulator
MDVKEMVMPETEKITINLPAVELGKIDLLVQEGVYSNRTDCIKAAIRSQLERHGLEIQQSVQRHAFVVGAYHVGRAELLRLRAKGRKLSLAVVGLLSLSKDIEPELAGAVISSVKVRGVFMAADEVKAVLRERMS